MSSRLDVGTTVRDFELPDLQGLFRRTRADFDPTTDEPRAAWAPGPGLMI